MQHVASKNKSVDPTYIDASFGVPDMMEKVTKQKRSIPVPACVKKKEGKERIFVKEQELRFYKSEIDLHTSAISGINLASTSCRVCIMVSMNWLREMTCTTKKEITRIRYSAASDLFLNCTDCMRIDSDTIKGLYIG